jgi:hypothetical protein
MPFANELAPGLHYNLLMRAGSNPDSYRDGSLCTLHKDGLLRNFLNAIFLRPILRNFSPDNYDY